MTLPYACGDGFSWLTWPMRGSVCFPPDPCLMLSASSLLSAIFFRASQERESLNASIVDAINQASDCWGIRCLRYEIKDIHVPPRVKESMQMQVWLSGRVVWNKREVSCATPLLSVQSWQHWPLLW